MNLFYFCIHKATTRLEIAFELPTFMQPIVNWFQLDFSSVYPYVVLHSQTPERVLNSWMHNSLLLEFHKSFLSGLDLWCMCIHERTWRWRVVS